MKRDAGKGTDTVRIKKEEASKGLYWKYFVLKPRSKKIGDPYAHASRQAIVQYAMAIEKYDKQLAEQLIMWVNAEVQEEHLR